LNTCGLLSQKDQIVVEQVVDIPYAYVVHDAVRYENLPKIMSYLKRNHIFSIGRYGSWGYLSMEDAIMQGKEVAEVLHG
jgi:protoporphyrinogen oxidase